MNSLAKVILSATVVVLPLIAAAWLIPPTVPVLINRLLLFLWGTGATFVAERVLFGGSWGRAARAVGFARARTRALVVAALVSIPMWVFLPILLRAHDTPVVLRAEWPAILLGVVLVNGVTEEVIHRGFVFGHLRRISGFGAAAALSAALFAAQHLYLIVTAGIVVGVSSVILAALLAFPLVFMFERGGNSIGAPALLHTSSNAPMLLLNVPSDLVGAIALPHMAVVLMSMYAVFLLFRTGGPKGPPLRSV